ncbi:unnamed protein product [Prunus armeniaca]
MAALVASSQWHQGARVRSLPGGVSHKFSNYHHRYCLGQDLTLITTRANERTACLVRAYASDDGSTFRL